jgi:hypothetical protein
MSGDIVERLRSWRCGDDAVILIDDAADEIERLRLSAGGDCPRPDNAAKRDRLTADIIDRLLAAVKADAPIPRAMVVLAAVEIERLRFAIARLAEQDATLSICDGNVTVTMDATFTDEERAVLRNVADDARYRAMAYTERVVRGLLERLGGGE